MSNPASKYAAVTALIFAFLTLNSPKSYAETIDLREDNPSGVELYLPQTVPNSELSTSPTRRPALKALFARVAGEGSDQDKIIRVTTFLQRHMFHPRWPPLDTAGVLVFDPTWLLETRLGQCGQTNRLLTDILSAGGYRTRVVQLFGHVAAEVRYGGKWHFLDADALSAGTFVMNRSGEIASTMEIVNDPSLLDGIEAYDFTRSYPVEVQHEALSLREAFSRRKYTEDGLLTPFAYVKTAKPEQEHDEYYGWTHYDTVPIDEGMNR